MIQQYVALPSPRRTVRDMTTPSQNHATRYFAVASPFFARLYPNTTPRFLATPCRSITPQDET